MIRLSLAIAIFIAGVASGVLVTGGATELFSEYGQCRFGLAQDGTFYQSDRHTDNYMRPACALVGFQDKWTERFGWKVGFLYTGSIQARGNMAVNDETRGYTGPCNMWVPPYSEANCAIRFDGSGNTFGFTFAFTAEQPITSHLSGAVESGLFFFQHHFKSEASFVDSEWRHISYNETSKLWDVPSPFVGLSLRYRDIYVAARRFWPSEHRALSLTNHAFWQFTAGVVAARF